VVAAARAAGATPEGTVVQRQAAPGRELIVGVRRDPVFGPVLAIGAGGLQVEQVAAVTRRLLPLADGEAAALAAALGAPAAEHAIRGVADLALALGRRLEALEVNPLIVGDEAAVAVDALLLLDER
jgi:succinyl-CoA synthetase beta subunit